MILIVYPNYNNKHKQEALFDPKHYLEYRKKIGKFPKIKCPESLILCYDFNIEKYVKENYVLKEINVFGKVGNIFSKKGKSILFMSGFGVGAPATVTIIEELIAWGIKNIISIGTSGCLQETIPLGSLILCDKAIRDEGTSSHYIKHSKYAYPSKLLTKKLEQTIKKLNVDYYKGTTWTIDAPYRETKAEIKKYKKEGVLTVEMEASAIFAIAKCRKVNAASLFTISDHLGESEWTPNFHKIDKSLELIFEVAKETLLM